MGDRKARFDSRNELLLVGIMMIRREKGHRRVLIKVQDPKQSAQNCRERATILGLHNHPATSYVAQFFGVEAFVRAGYDNQGPLSADARANSRSGLAQQRSRSK